jgi:hypothetical protein
MRRALAEVLHLGDDAAPEAEEDFRILERVGELVHAGDCLQLARVARFTAKELTRRLTKHANPDSGVDGLDALDQLRLQGEGDDDAWHQRPLARRSIR